MPVNEHSMCHAVHKDGSKHPRTTISVRLAALLKSWLQL